MRRSAQGLGKFKIALHRKPAHAKRSGERSAASLVGGRPSWNDRLNQSYSNTVKAAGDVARYPPATTVINPVLVAGLP